MGGRAVGRSVAPAAPTACQPDRPSALPAPRPAAAQAHHAARLPRDLGAAVRAGRSFGRGAAGGLVAGWLGLHGTSSVRARGLAVPKISRSKEMASYAWVT